LSCSIFKLGLCKQKSINSSSDKCGIRLTISKSSNSKTLFLDSDFLKFAVVVVISLISIKISIFSKKSPPFQLNRHPILRSSRQRNPRFDGRIRRQIKLKTLCHHRRNKNRLHHCKIIAQTNSWTSTER